MEIRPHGCRHHRVEPDRAMAAPYVLSKDGGLQIPGVVAVSRQRGPVISGEERRMDQDRPVGPVLSAGIRI